MVTGLITSFVRLREYRRSEVSASLQPPRASYRQMRTLS
jgi:hypothetical protein